MTRLRLIQDNPTFSKEIEYIFRVFASILGIRSEGHAGEQVFPDGISTEQDIFLVYSHHDPVPEGRCKIIIRPSEFFGNNYMKLGSLPQLPLKRTQEGTPIIYLGDASAQVWVKRSKNVLETNMDIIASSFFMLSGYEEILSASRDKHGRFPSTDSLAYREGFLNIPIVNEYAEMLWDWMQGFGLGLTRKPLWDGRDFAVCVTHDVDSIKKYHFLSEMKEIVSFVLEQRRFGRVYRKLLDYVEALLIKGDPYDTFAYMLDVEGRSNIRSSFYFLTKARGEADPFGPCGYDLSERNVRSIIRRIEYAACEIGLHTSYDACVNRDSIRAEKAALQRLLCNLGMGIRELGCRQHYMRWKTPDSWVIRDELGFLYDTTLYYADHEGYRCGICVPFRAYDAVGRRELSIYEVPLTVMDGTLSDDAYQGLSPSEALQAIVRLVDTVKRYHGVFVLLWHNSHLDEGELPGWRKVYEETIDYVKQYNIWGESVREIVEWWKKNAEPERNQQASNTTLCGRREM